MESKKPDFLSIFMFIIALFTVYFQIFQPQTQVDKLTSMILFSVILIYLGIVYAASYYFKKVKALVDQININKKNIEEINNKMETEKKFNDIDKRISILESLKRNKKGQSIDPKWVLFIILLILFYLYLRSLGIVP